MVLNLRPTEMGLLDCIIEECDMRFTADQQEEILEVVKEVLCNGAEEGEAVNGISGQMEVETNGHGT